MGAPFWRHWDIFAQAAIYKQEEGEKVGHTTLTLETTCRRSTRYWELKFVGIKDQVLLDHPPSRGVPEGDGDVGRDHFCRGLGGHFSSLRISPSQLRADARCDEKDPSQLSFHHETLLSSRQDCWATTTGRNSILHESREAWARWESSWQVLCFGSIWQLSVLQLSGVIHKFPFTLLDIAVSFINVWFNITK